MPIETPLSARIAANSGYGKSIGNNSSSPKLSAALSIPAVAKPRAPKRSDRRPDVGPATSIPIVSGSM